MAGDLTETCSPPTTAERPWGSVYLSEIRVSGVLLLPSEGNTGQSIVGKSNLNGAEGEWGLLACSWLSELFSHFSPSSIPANPCPVSCVRTDHRAKGETEHLNLSMADIVAPHLPLGLQSSSACFEAWLQIPALPHFSCVTLHKSPKFPELWLLQITDTCPTEIEYKLHL